METTYRICLLIVIGYPVITYLINRISRNRPALNEAVKDAPVLPSVSILLVLHNNAFILDEYIQKLVAAKYPRFEILIYDDNSKDQSWEISMLRDYSNIRRFRGLKGNNETLGNLASWQFLANQAQGDVLLCVDCSDDFSDSTLVGKIMTVLVREDATAVALSGKIPFLEELLLPPVWQKISIANTRILAIRKHAFIQECGKFNENSNLKRNFRKRGEKIVRIIIADRVKDKKKPA